MSKEKQATPSKELYSQLMDQSVPKSELEWYASRIIRGCMKAMPCGHITTHTPSNLARRIRDMVKELTIYDIDLDRAEDEIKELELYVYQSLHVSQASKLSKDNKIRIRWERGQKHFEELREAQA